MNITKLYSDFHIPYASPSQRHYRAGWVNTACPFCSGNAGNHLGFCTDPQSKYFNSFVCHRCGGHGVIKTLSKLLNVSNQEASSIYYLYGGKLQFAKPLPVPKPKMLKSCVLPPNRQDLALCKGAQHYLTLRGFKWQNLSKNWLVQATGPGSIISIDGKLLNYSYRLIIPIYYDGKLVTYQARDWTGKRSPKYLAAHPSKESKPIKSILYGLDQADGEEAVLVEGVTDVWRIGAGAVACFGVKYRPEQVRELINRYKRVIVVADPEPRANLQMRKICKDLEDHRVEVRQVRLPKGKDPADMTKEEIRRLIWTGKS